MNTKVHLSAAYNEMCETAFEINENKYIDIRTTKSDKSNCARLTKIAPSGYVERKGILLNHVGRKKLGWWWRFHVMDTELLVFVGGTFMEAVEFFERLKNRKGFLIESTERLV